MVINLKERKKKTFDLTLLDGTELHIRKANDELIYAMEDFEKKARKMNGVKEVFEEVKKLTLQILNRNDAKKLYDNLFLDQKDEYGDTLYDYTTCMTIFSEYSKFMQETLRNPN